MVTKFVLMLSKEIIKSRIHQHEPKMKELGIDLIGFFGSYARGDQNQQSDIDILISFQEDKSTFHNFMEVCYLLEKIFEGVKVDVVTKEGLNPYIGPKILQEVEYV